MASVYTALCRYRFLAMAFGRVSMFLQSPLHVVAGEPMEEAKDELCPSPERFIPEGVQTWGELCDVIPEWGDRLKSFVFHRDHERVNREGQPPCLVQRLQKSGLCHLHGPAVLQHYLVAMGTENPEEAIPTIDLRNYIRQTFGSFALYKYIFEDDGRFSVAALEQMLIPDSEVGTFNVNVLQTGDFAEGIPSVVDQYSLGVSVSSPRRV